MNKDIYDRAAHKAEETLHYFDNIEALGNFVGENVNQQKLVYLTRAFAIAISEQSNG